MLARGDGVYVIDEHGQRYLEGMAGLWCANLGFSDRVWSRRRASR